jgi:hypothetical protein
MNKQQRNQKRQELRIERFNEEYKPGETVLVKDDFGTMFADRLQAPASLLPSGLPVAWLETKGSYSLERVIGKGAGNG